MRLSQSLIDRPIVVDDDRLTADIVEHLGQMVPEVVTAYPPGYFIALVRHSARLGRDRFGIDEVAALRLFVRLRWDIAPGYYNEPRIAAALARQDIPAIARFEVLTDDDGGQTWLDAMQYDGPAYWRGQYSDGFGDMVFPKDAT